MKKVVCDVLVIGSGPSGLMAAILASEKRKVTILEKDCKDFKLAKRILVSGNGRANFFNEDLLSLNIDERYQFLLMKDHVNYANEFLSFLQEKGFAYSKEGRLYYPYFKRSECLHSFLLSLLKRCEIKKGTALSVDRKNRLVLVKEKEEEILYSYNDLVVSIGGRSFDRKDYSYDLLNSLNVRYLPYLPMLCPVRTKEMIPSYLNKQRLRGVLSLYHDDNCVYSEEGEILFKEDGISGICVFDATKYLLDEKRRCKDKKDYIFLFDYASPLKKNVSIECYPLFLKRYLKDMEMNKDDYLSFTFEDLYPFSDSQASYGGVLLDELDKKTLFLKKDRHVALLGEMLDINLPCGGYNMGVSLVLGYRVGKELGDFTHAIQ